MCSSDLRDIRIRNQTKKKKKAIKADKKRKTIAGRILREREKKLGDEKPYKEKSKKQTFFMFI